jgi:hypothetical protein
MFKSHLIKLNHRVLPRKNKVDNYGMQPCIAPDYSATVLAAKMCITHMSTLSILYVSALYLLILTLFIQVNADISMIHFPENM